MSILYIRLPSKAAADGVEHWLALPCHFALASQAGAVEREGILPLSELAGAVAVAQRVVLLLAASDVTLLRVKTPPLSAAKLKLALPNLIEEHLMSDPSECVVVPGEQVDGLRTAAVVQRGWLDILSKTFTNLGARSLVAVPAQLCLPLETDGVVAAITEQEADLDIAIRISPQDGMGLPILSEQSLAPAEVFSVLRAIVPGNVITLYVPKSHLEAYTHQASIGDPEDEATISVVADSWTHWIDAARALQLNLLSGLGASSGPQVNIRRWRWPIALVILILIINALGLNIGWWNMKREASTLRAGMLQTFRSAYPKETVILDAVAQMHRKIEESQRAAGLAAPDDFVQLAASFGEVFAGEGGDPAAHKAAINAIASLEYRDRSLLVHLKPDSQISMDKMKAALAARNLNLSSPSAGVWQIRSEK